MYNKILKQHNMNSSFWIDIAGNHDTYGVLQRSDPDFYASKYLLHSDFTKKTINDFTFSTSQGSYKFIIIDASPTPGFMGGFEGVISKKDRDELGTILSNIPKKTKHTFLVSHYPFKMVLTYPATPLVWVTGYSHFFLHIFSFIFLKNKAFILFLLRLLDISMKRVYTQGIVEIF